MARADSGDLVAQASQFANEVQDLLNKTVCNGAIVTAVVAWDSELKQNVVIVGTKLAGGLVANPVPVSTDGKKAKCWIEVQYRCDVDERGYLRVLTSYFGIYGEGRVLLCHYDYERTKEGYPAAHVQIEGVCPALDALPGDHTAEQLAKLHFPVGGRRYRPTIEDMVEFLVNEGFAAGRRGYQKVIDEHRERFHEIQLKAAIRRKPDIARAVLEQIAQEEVGGSSPVGGRRRRGRK